MVKRLTLSDDFITRYEFNRDKVHDSKVPHLCITRQARTGLTFYVYAKIGDRPHKKMLGRYPAIGIEEARELAQRFIEVQKASIVPKPPSGDRYLKIVKCPRCSHAFDPNTAWKGRLTIKQLFQRYYEDHVVVRCRSKDAIRENFVRYFATLKDRHAESLTPYDVQSWHNSIATKIGRATANRCLQLLKALLNFGIKWQIIDSRNPTAAVKKFTEEARDRFVSSDEMPVLLDAIEKHSTVMTKDVFKLCLYTGQRIQNVCTMKWSDVNFKTGIWKISSADFKTGHSHEVPLVNEVLEILLNRRGGESHSAFVFPGRLDSNVPMRWTYKAWQKLLVAANIPDLTPHDLRRTHATYQAATGASLVVIARTLGHRDFKSTAIYARLPVESIRTAMKTAVAAMRASS